MDDRTTGLEERPPARLRLIRAGLFTALCLTLSAATHVLLSRSPLPAATLGVAAGSVFTVAFWAAGKERGFWQIAGLLVPFELAMDYLFTQGQESCYGASGGPLAGSIRSLTELVLCSGGPGVATAVELPIGPVSPWLLLLAHLAVGTLAAWWLWQGEATAFALVRTLAAYATAPLRPILGLTPAPTFPSPVPYRGRDIRLPMGVTATRHSVVRRGPPCPSRAR